MSEQQRIKAQDVGNELIDAIGAIWKWLVLVAAIAVGTCLGMMLFTFVVANVVDKSLRDANVYPFVTATP